MDNLVSIIMPVYDNIQYLSATVESILNQTYTEFELIIIANTPLTAVKNIIQAYAYNDKRIRYYFNTALQSTAEIMNRGMLLANGNIIAQQRTNDISGPSRIEKEVTYLLSRPVFCEVVSTWGYTINNAGVRIFDPHSCDESRQSQKIVNYRLRAIPACHSINGATIMYTRRAFDTIGFYDETLTQGAANYNYHVRLSRYFDVHIIPEELYAHRERDEDEVKQKEYRTSAFNSGSKKSVIRTRNTADDEHVSVVMATMPERKEQMLKTVDRFLPICDDLYICLNEYEEIPPELNREHVHTFLTGDSIMPNLFDMGKLYWANKLPGYYLTIDDDISYPADYAYNIIQGIEKYKRKAVVGYHGAILALKDDGYIAGEYKTARHIFPYEAELTEDLEIHKIGTGLAGWHTSLLPDIPDIYGTRGLDAVLSTYLCKRDIPIYVLKHAERWIVPTREWRIKSQSKNYESHFGTNKRLHEVKWKKLPGAMLRPPRQLTDQQYAREKNNQNKHANNPKASSKAYTAKAQTEHAKTSEERKAAPTKIITCAPKNTGWRP